MAAAIVRRTDTGFTVQRRGPLQGLDARRRGRHPAALNEAGVAATEEALRRFDADGEPIRLGPTKLTSMGKVRKEYQTPYGVAAVERHVYQGSKGGKTYCPLDRDARIVVSSTPRFAKMIAHKYAEFGAARVLEDLAENHGREVAKAFVQDVADAVAAVALAKEEAWEYDLPAFDGAGGHGDRRAGRDLHADGRGGLAGGDGRHAWVLQRGRRAAAHRLHGGHARVRQADVLRAVRPRARPGQGGLPRRAVRGAGRRGEGQLDRTSTR